MILGILEGIILGGVASRGYYLVPASTLEIAVIIRHGQRKGSRQRLLVTGRFFPTVPGPSTVGKNLPEARRARADPARGACRGSCTGAPRGGNYARN
jgi:hypothetical protein